MSEDFEIGKEFEEEKEIEEKIMKKGRKIIKIEEE